jgi:hypothetical protein
LLDGLAKHFVANHYNLRTCANDSPFAAYQLRLPNEHNLTDKQNFAVLPQRLAAEVLLDVDLATG